jgi:hypothetical protein
VRIGLAAIFLEAQGQSRKRAVRFRCDGRRQRIYFGLADGANAHYENCNCGQYERWKPSAPGAVVLLMHRAPRRTLSPSRIALVIDGL